MEKIYIVITHENDVESDSVEIQIVTSDYEKAQAKYLEIEKEWLQNDELVPMEKLFDYCNFTNEHNEWLYSVEIVESDVE